MDVSFVEMTIMDFVIYGYQAFFFHNSNLLVLIWSLIFKPFIFDFYD